jgi:hypothetical protein
MSRIVERIHTDVSDAAWKQTAMSSGLEVCNKIWLNHFVIIKARIEDCMVSQVYEDLENDEY